NAKHFIGAHSSGVLSPSTPGACVPPCQCKADCLVCFTFSMTKKLSNKRRRPGRLFIPAAWAPPMSRFSSLQRIIGRGRQTFRDFALVIIKLVPALHPTGVAARTSITVFHPESPLP